MASKSYPRAAYNGGAITELEHERLVNALAPDGLLGDPAAPAMAYADGTGTRQVKIRAGRLAVVRGGQYDSGDVDINLPQLAANTSGLTRIDLAVLRLNRGDYSITETVITGQPGGAAPSPVQQTGPTGFWDLPLAEVTVVNGAGSLAAGAVIPRAWYVGDDGQIRCTQTTRPPVQAGRRFREIDTGRTLESNGTRWFVVLEDTGALFVGAAGGWSAQAGNTVRRKNGWVMLNLVAIRVGGAVNNATNSLVCTVPERFRPSQDLTFTPVLSNPDHATNGLVLRDGRVFAQANFSEGINTSSFIFGNVTYPVDDAT